MSNTIKAIGLLGILIVLCSCEPTIKFSPSNGLLRPPPKADTSDITVYNKTDKIPRHAVVLGEIKVDEAGLTTNCGYDYVVECAKNKAREVGADAIKITEVKKPDLLYSTCYRLTANAIYYPKTPEDRITYKPMDTIATLKESRNSTKPQEAAKSLGDTKTPEYSSASKVMDAIATLEESRDSTKPQEATKSLDDIKTPEDSTTSKLMDAIATFEESWDYDERLQAIKLLGDIGDARAVEALCKILSESSYYSQSVHYALGKIGGNKAIGALKKSMRQSSSRIIRKSAAKNLFKLNWVPPTQQEKIAYYILLENHDELVKLGEAAVESLIKDFERDTFAAAVLGNIGDSRAIEPLVESLKDWRREPVVSKALSKLGWKPVTKEEKIRFNLASDNSNGKTAGGSFMENAVR